MAVESSAPASRRSQYIATPQWADAPGCWCRGDLFLFAFAYASSPVFHRFLDLHQKPICGGAVEDAMIERKREIHHGANGNGILDHNHSLLHRADSQDSALWLVDDRKGEQRAAGAMIGQCERPAFDFIWLELFRARPRGKVIDCARHR